MLQRLRETLVLILIALLPFHALLVTVGTNMIAGPGRAPLAALAVWKEVLLFFVLGIVFIELLRRPARSRTPQACAGTGGTALAIRSVDALDFLILFLLFLALPPRCSDLTPGWFYGFKYDFVPLVAFLVLRRAEWSESFAALAVRVLLITGVIVAAYGIAALFLLPSFFVWLGYSDLHSLYLPDGPIAAFQQIGGTGIRRAQSVLSGPNQLGLWLLIPLSIVVTAQHRKGIFRFPVSVFCLICAALLLTFSRSAWVAAAVILLIAAYRRLPRETFRTTVLALSAAACIAVILGAVFAPGVLFRGASTRDHLARPLEAARLIRDHPFGLGLGSAGPAANRMSDACVRLPADGDVSWAADRPDLCVFLGERQVQPVGRACHCPVLPENWYLQIGVELGVAGFALFVWLVVLVIVKLEDGSRKLLDKAQDKLGAGEGGLPSFSFLLPAFIAIAIAAFFLHAFEDGAVAYTVWILAAVGLRPGPIQRTPQACAG